MHQISSKTSCLNHYISLLLKNSLQSLVLHGNVTESRSNFLRSLQQNNLWFRVWLTSDLRVGIAIPGDPTKFTTKEIFGTPVIRDPANNLAALKAREAKVYQQPLFTESVLSLRFGEPDFTRLISHLVIDLDSTFTKLLFWCFLKLSGGRMNLIL